jgi:hypothetical protein
MACGFYAGKCFTKQAACCVIYACGAMVLCIKKEKSDMKTKVKPAKAIISHHVGSSSDGDLTMLFFVWANRQWWPRWNLYRIR